MTSQRMGGDVPRAGVARAADADAMSETPARAKRRILVADDQPDVRTAVSELLRSLGHEVRAAVDGAIAIAREWQPDVAVLDVFTPRLDGFAVARALRSEFSAERMRIVVMTGYPLDESTLENAGGAAFDVCLDKAFTLEALDEAIGGAQKRGQR
jgi:CheY-like chemotaxis protein